MVEGRIDISNDESDPAGKKKKKKRNHNDIYCISEVRSQWWPQQKQFGKEEIGTKTIL